MSDRDVWVKAGMIFVEHGTLTPEYILQQLGDGLDSRAASEDWCRIAAAVNAISIASLQ
jgi:hypothetical protein